MHYGFSLQFNLSQLSKAFAKIGYPSASLINNESCALALHIMLCRLNLEDLIEIKHTERCDEDLYPWPRTWVNFEIHGIKEGISKQEFFSAADAIQEFYNSGKNEA